jgi:uncharacterized cupin superfamily protein
VITLAESVTMAQRHPNVLNLSEVEPREQKEGVRFGFKTRLLGKSAGARGIGASWYEVEPGRAAYPSHFHCANEEAIFVLEGEGTLRIGSERVAVRAGDWITRPTGPDHAHQLINTGTAPLRYLCMSTLLTTELVGYPDSDKIGAMAVTVPGQPPAIRAIFRKDTQAGYYDGERADEPF